MRPVSLDEARRRYLTIALKWIIMRRPHDQAAASGRRIVENKSNIGNVSLGGSVISRRGLILSAGATGFAAAAVPRCAFAAGAEAKLKVGFVSPRTGALGGFGATDGYVLEVVRKALA